MAFIITFWVSFALLIAIFALKMWEIKNGNVLCAAARTRVDSSLSNLARSLRSRAASIPQHISLSKVLHSVAHSLILFFARIANFTERKAHALAMRVSSSARKHEACEDYKGASSQFLQDVAEHKEGLDIEAIKRETRL